VAVDTKASPLVIFGLDAGDGDLIKRWAQEGYLPTISSIMRRGCWGTLTGPEQITEHGVWISLLSGISRAQHGYYHWRPLKPGTYELQLSNFREVDAVPFWACLQGSDKRVAIIDAPEVDIVAGLSGVQVANWAPHNPHFATCAEPAELLTDLRRRFGSQRPVEEKVDGSIAQDRKIYRGLLEQIEQKGALSRYLITPGRFDLIFVGFSETHIAGHQFWGYRPQAQKPNSATSENELTRAIRKVYQAIDRQIGLLLTELPERSNVFIVSQVGIQDDYPNLRLLEAFCRQLGYQVPAESAPLSLRPLALARRIIPEAWRISLSRHLPRQTRERLLADQFRSSTNWRRTSAFPIPAFYTGFIRINLRGREPEGIVEPGPEYEALLDRLEADLKQLVDPQTGEPAAKRVARTVELFGGGPPSSLPDLFVEWFPTPYFKRRVVHPEAVLVQEELQFHRNSHHTHTGFLAAVGPSIHGRGEIGEVPLLDLAPTFLSSLGQPIPEKLPGKLIEAVAHG